MADKRSGTPMRVRVAAKETIQLRPYETTVVEIGIEVDHGTPKAEIVQAIDDAEVIYTLLRDKVHARAAEERAKAAAEQNSKGVDARLQIESGKVAKVGWAHQPSPPRKPR